MGRQNLDTNCLPTVDLVQAQGKKVKDKSKGKSYLCINQQQTGHPEDKCWKKYPHLEPKGLRSKEEKKAALVAQVIEIHGLKEPNSTLNIMAIGTKDPTEEDPREHKQTLFDAVVDT